MAGETVNGALKVTLYMSLPDKQQEGEESRSFPLSSLPSGTCCAVPRPANRQAGGGAFGQQPRRQDAIFVSLGFVEP